MVKLSKCSGHWQTFNPNWFRNNQKKILSYVNGSWLKRKISRYALRLDTKEDLIEIGPHYYKVGLPDGQFQVDFRTHDKYSKRVYYSLFLFWWALHFLDWLLLDKFLPQHSFGFSTLTAYPQAGGGGANTTCDGELQNSVYDGTWAQNRNGAGTWSYTVNPYGAFYNISGGPTVGKFSAVSRSSFTFNTSTLGSGSTISDATFSVYGYSIYKNAWAGNFSLNIVSSFPASNNNLVNSDYSNFGSTSFSNIAELSFAVNSYNDFSLNLNGINNISKTNISGFGGRSGSDLLNIAPNFYSGYDYAACEVYFSDYTGNTRDPKLVVTYTEAQVVTYKPGAIIVS
jgi:hypothetical protein